MVPWTRLSLTVRPGALRHAWFQSSCTLEKLYLSEGEYLSLLRKPSITLNFDLYISLSLVTVYRLSKSGWLSVCISDEMGTQQQKNEALLWNSASGVSASCLDCSVLWSGCVIWTTVQYECRGREYYLIRLRVEWTCHGITHTHAHSLILVSWRLILSHRNRLRMKSYITRWFSLIRTMLQTYLQFRSIQWDVCEHNSKGSVNSCSTSLAAT